MTAKMISQTRKSVDCITLQDFGSYDNINLTTRPRVILKKDQVRVNVKACGINFNDLYAWQGIYIVHDLRPPFVMGSECSGEIIEVGEEVKQDYEIGDRVMCWDFNYGMWREGICISSQKCFKIPESMSYLDAAAFCMNYISAYIAIIDYGNLKPGETVYLQTAAGGIGCAAIQLAKTVDNVTIIGSASPSKHKYLMEQGLKHCFDSTKPSVTKEIEKLYPNGVDIIMSTIIGSEAAKSRKLLRTLGRFIYVGAVNLLQGEKRRIGKVFKILFQGKTVCDSTLVNKNRFESGFNLALLFEKDSQRFRSILKELLNLYESGALKPAIDSIWTFNEVQKAIARLLERKNIGKVIIVPRMLPEFETKVNTHI